MFWRQIKMNVKHCCVQCLAVIAFNAVTFCRNYIITTRSTWYPSVGYQPRSLVERLLASLIIYPLDNEETSGNGIIRCKECVSHDEYLRHLKTFTILIYSCLKFHPLQNPKNLLFSKAYFLNLLKVCKDSCKENQEQWHHHHQTFPPPPSWSVKSL